MPDSDSAGERASVVAAAVQLLPVAEAPTAFCTGTQRCQAILVIDDEPALVSVLTRFLRRCGYEVGSAGDGESGWIILQQRTFDLLITDHEMPVLKGLDLVRRLRGSSSRLPVVLLSGNLPSGEVDLVDLLTPGIALGKPIELDLFLGHVRRLLYRE